MLEHNILQKFVEIYHLNGWDIPFLNHVKYVGVIFDKRIT
jgi:hypothetical protein